MIKETFLSQAGATVAFGLRVNKYWANKTGAHFNDTCSQRIQINGFLPTGFNYNISSFRQSAAKATVQSLSEWRGFLLTASFKKIPWLRSTFVIGCRMMRFYPNVISAWNLWPWPCVKVKTRVWETASSDGWVRYVFVSLNGEVMSHTTLNKQPAGMQLACTTRPVRVGLRLSAVLPQQQFKPCFPLHFQKCFYVWISVRSVSVCMCVSHF